MFVKLPLGCKFFPFRVGLISGDKTIDSVAAHEKVTIHFLNDIAKMRPKVASLTDDLISHT